MHVAMEKTDFESSLEIESCLQKPLWLLVLIQHHAKIADTTTLGVVPQNT